jgi:hypothetical protein
MVQKIAVALLLAVGTVTGVPGPVRAFPLILDYTGFSWSTPDGGSPMTFSAVGVLDGFSRSVYDPAEVYTFCLSGLKLQRVISEVHSPSVSEYVYSGGTFGVYRSTDRANRRYDYGTNPAGGLVQASFTDGVPWLFGRVSAFSFVRYNPFIGTLNARGSFTSGEFLANLLDPNWSTFAGMTAHSVDGVPGGYAYRLDGQETATLRPIPEPASVALLGIGLTAGALLLRRRRGA